MNKEEINNEADLLAKAERLKKLEKKYSYRTESERLAPFFKIFIGMSFLLQLLSALFAAGGVLLLSVMFAKSFAVVVAITVILLIALETFKRLSYNEYNRQRNSKEKLSITIIFFCLLSGVLSVSSSFVGAEHTIKYFSAEAELVDTSVINNNYKLKLASNLSHWGNIEAKATEEHEELKNDNTNSKGVVYWHALKTLTKMKDKSGGYKDSLLKYESIIKEANASEIKAATKENENRKNKKAGWVSSFGSYSAFASLGFEVALFLILFWCSNFEKREIKEAQTLTKEPVKEPTKTIKEAIKKVVKNVQQTTAEPSLVTNSMQIKTSKEQNKEKNKDEPKEGDIIPPTGKQKAPRIWVSLDEGTRLKLCRASDINNYIRGNDPERAEQFKKYLVKINTWKNENKQ